MAKRVQTCYMPCLLVHLTVLNMLQSKLVGNVTCLNLFRHDYACLNDVEPILKNMFQCF